MRLASCFAAALLTLSGLSAHATRLTFEGLPSGAVGTTTNTGFGDRISVPGTGYTLDGGTTPNIVLNFVPLVSSQANFEVYGSGYSGLVSALGDNSFNVPGYVELIPDAGWDVVLDSFQLGAWSSSTYPNSQVRITNAGGTLFDTGLFSFAGNTVYTYPAAPLRSTSAMRVYISDFGDLGLDNFQFSQVATVPEPGIWALMLAGTSLLGALARRRRRG